MRRSLSRCSLALALIALGVFPVQASAHAGGPGDFSCRASALRVSVKTPSLLFEPSVANAPGSPCTDDVVTGRGGAVAWLGTAAWLDARTADAPGGRAGGQAAASIARAALTVGHVRVEIGALEARASSFCSTATGEPVLSGSSTVAQLRINGGAPVTFAGPATIPLGVATLHINRRIVSGGAITQRALELEVPRIGLLGPVNLVLAEAVADVERCEPPNGSPPAALLEIKTPPDCAVGVNGEERLSCDMSKPRTVWTSSSEIPDEGFAWYCQAPYEQCDTTLSFRGTGSSDPDDDIASWSIDFGDGTSASGDWSTNPPTEVTHAYPPFADAGCCGTATLTVTDPAGQSDSDAISVASFDITPD